MIKVTKKERILTGAEKAAVLFMSIGEVAWTDVAHYLHADEIEKLKVTFKSLRYGPKEEVRVLLELEEYGKSKGIWKEVPDEDGKADKVQDIKNAAAQDPEEVAKLIASWLDTGNKG